MITKNTVYLIAFWAIGIMTGLAQNVNVDVNLNIKHSVDGVSDFGRERHITIHSSLTEPDWEGHEDMLDYLINDLDVYFGRDNGSAGWKNRLVTEDPNKPHWPDTNAMVDLGNGLKEWYESSAFRSRHQYEKKSPMIMGMTEYPVYPTMSWDAIGTAEGGWQPFDVDASASWLAHYLDKYFSKNPGDIGEPLPKYWEGINEADITMLGAGGMFLTSPEKLWEFHNLLAKEMRDLLGDKAPLIGGMTWGQHDFYGNDFFWRHDVEKDYFKVCRDNPDCTDETLAAYHNMVDSEVWGHRKKPWFQWDAMWQGFIDAAGANMDFYGVHIYDWPKAEGNSISTDGIRSGGHVEAMLDLMEWYDITKFGAKKDIVLSEYGSVSGISDELPYKRRDWEQLRPFNQMLMQFLERPSHVVLTMPFAPVKAYWGDEWDANGNLVKRYISTLMDPVGEYKAPGSAHKEWEWSGNILFYELWSDVDGTRIDTKASINDVQVDAYVNGNHVYLILNNLETTPQAININLFDDYANKIEGVHTKHLRLNRSLGTEGLPVIDEKTLGSDPGTIVLDDSATMILDYTFASPVTIDQTSVETKFASIPLTTERNMIGGIQCHVAVGGRSTLTTEVNNVIVPTGAAEAIVRIGGVYFDITPESVTVNGNEIITEPINMRGRVKTRGRTYGVWEVPVPIEYLKANNVITCRADGNNNEYSTVMLQVWDFSKAPGRSENGDKNAVASIALDGAASVMKGEEEPIAVTFTPVNATNKTITWTSSNPAVATVDEFGVVTAVAASGSTTITAVSEDNTSATATKTITAIPFSTTPVTGLEIAEGSSITIPNFINTPLEAIVAPADATVQDIVWTSSNPDAVKVNRKTGKIIGEIVGGSSVITATLTDTASGNKVFEKSITVSVTIEGEETVFCRDIPKTLQPFQTFELEVPVRILGKRDIVVELWKSGTLLGSGTQSVDAYGDTSVKVSYNLGTVPAVGNGYKVIARIKNGNTELSSCSADVEMLDHYRAESVSVIDGVRGVRIGENISLAAEVLPSNTFNKTIRWSSNNSSIARVDAATGVVTGVGNGVATITATTDDGGYTDSVEVTSQSGIVVVPVTGINIPAKILIFPNGNEIIGASFIPEWTTQTDVIWSSSTPSIATIDANGKITAGATQGNTTITATSIANSSIKATSLITVSKTLVIEAEEFASTGGAFDGFRIYEVNGVGGINYNQAGDWGDYEVNFPESGEYEVTYYLATPNTDVAVSMMIDGVLQSETVVPVGPDFDSFKPLKVVGNITVVAGVHTVRLLASGTESFQWNMDRFELKNVSSTGGTDIAVTGVTVNPTAVTLTSVGATQVLSKTIVPANATNQLVSWSSSNTAVATVNASGLVTAVANGTATVKATTQDENKEAFSTITVNIPVTAVSVTGVAVSPNTVSLAVGGIQTLNAAISPVNATNKTVTWSSNNVSVATVNQIGEVTGIAPGTAIITATSIDGGFDANTTVTVTGDTPSGGEAILVIQAEDFSTTGGAFEGFQIYTTGGVTAINYNQTGDWAEYTVNIPQGGSYSVEYFIGTPLNGTAIEFIVDGVSQMKDNVPNNGSWDSFVSMKASQNVTLTSGTHVIRLLGAGTNGWEWNMDRFVLTKDNTAARGIGENNAISIHPNPANEFFYIKGFAGKELFISIYDAKGVEYVNKKIKTADQIKIGNLAEGLYFVLISSTDGAFQESFKLIISD